MLITRIEEGKGNKYRIFGDDRFLFSLYGKELKQYHIQIGVEIQEILIRDILENVIYKRAKERALFLLEKSPFSVYMMKNKLQDNDYPEEIINQVIFFLKQYHYLDDEEYVKLYVRSYLTKKSKRQIMTDLLRKGISKEVAETYFDENLYSEEISFSRQFERYIRGKDLDDYSTRQKVFRHFYNKGFTSDLIESYIRAIEL